MARAAAAAAQHAILPRPARRPVWLRLAGPAEGVAAPPALPPITAPDPDRSSGGLADHHRRDLTSLTSLSFEYRMDLSSLCSALVLTNPSLLSNSCTDSEDPVASFTDLSLP